jgi:hypothetical protein
LKVVVAAGLVALGALVAGCDGCDGCDGPPAALRVGGAHPYVRCLFMEPPEARTVRAGGVTLSVEGREATVQAPEGPLRVAAFPGPAPRRHGLGPFMENVAAEQPHLLLLVGNLGDAVEDAQRTLVDVASAVPVPVLVLAGGRDDATILTRALAGVPAEVAGRVVDARGLWRVRHGGAELLLVSGAPEGRHARVDTACGFGADDLDRMAAELGDAEGEGRALISWAAPRGFGAPGLGAQDGGSPALATFADALSVTEAAFAWPAPGRGAHFAPAGAGQGRWLAPPSPGDGDAESPAILMTWSPGGLRVGGSPN